MNSLTDNQIDAALWTVTAILVIVGLFSDPEFLAMLCWFMFFYTIGWLISKARQWRKDGIE